MPGLLLLWWQRTQPLDAVTPVVAAAQRQVMKILSVTGTLSPVIQKQVQKTMSVTGSLAIRLQKQINKPFAISTITIAGVQGGFVSGRLLAVMMLTTPALTGERVVHLPGFFTRMG